MHCVAVAARRLRFGHSSKFSTDKFEEFHKKAIKGVNTNGNAAVGRRCECAHNDSVCSLMCLHSRLCHSKTRSPCSRAR